MLFSLGQKMRQLIYGDKPEINNDMFASDGHDICIGPDKEHPYMTVFLSKAKTRFGMRLRVNGYRPIVYLDVKAIPELITALGKLNKELGSDS